MLGERPRCDAGAGPGCGECRCACGSLLARLVDGAVELKCRRCKRTLLLPLGAGPSPAPPSAPVQRPRSAPLGAAG